MPIHDIASNLPTITIVQRTQPDQLQIIVANTISSPYPSHMLVDGLLDVIPYTPPYLNDPTTHTLASATAHALDVATAYLSALTLPHLPYNHPTVTLTSVYPRHHIIDPTRTYTNTHSQRSPRPKQAHLSISPTAWQHITNQAAHYGYAGHSKHTGLTHYLRALLQANPDPLIDWTDNRPASLTDYDTHRLNNGLFPFWSSATITDNNKRSTRMVNAAHLEEMQPVLLTLADFFIIAPFRAASQTDPRARAHAVLEAIGLQYLQPKNPPAHNPSPIGSGKYKDYHKYGANAAKEFAF